MFENEANSTSFQSTESFSENLNLLNQQPLSQYSDIIIDIIRIRPEYDNIISIINNLNNFCFKLKSLKNVEVILRTDVLLILQKLSEFKDIKINIILYKIYLEILSKESLYKNYLALNNNYINTYDKISLLLYLIDECVLLIEKLNGFAYEQGLFIFKNRTIQLIQYIYYNIGNKIIDQDKINKLKDLLTNLPAKFFSRAYLELNQNNDLFDIFNSQDVKKVTDFEDKFLDINNYYEQYEIFKKFVKYNCGEERPKEKTVDLGSQINEINNNKNIIINEKNDDFILNFGLLLLKFSKYHFYIFLDKEEKKEEKEVLNEYNTRTVFLLDKIKFVSAKDSQNQQPNIPSTANQKNVNNILKDKEFISVLYSNEYNQLINKIIVYYLNNTKNFDSNPKIKKIREEMSYYIDTFDKNIYVPVYLKSFKNVTFHDNFTPAFSTNVPAGKENKLYIETIPNEQILVFVEFFLEDNNKDITFEVNRYDNYSNTFKQIYREEGVDELFKFFIMCDGYSLYEIVFNNDYSWFNSKDINYRISLLKHLSIPHALKGCEFCCNINGKNVWYNNEMILKRISDKEAEKYININVILYNNNLRIVSIDKNENKKEELNFKELIEKEEKYIPKHFFDYSLICQLKKLKIKPEENKRIIITIFSQNRDITKLSKDIEEEIIKNENNKNSVEILKKIGFTPTPILGNYKVEYRIYDLCEQILVYHLFTCKYKKIAFDKNILFLKFDKFVLNYAFYSEGVISTNLKERINNDNCKTYEEFIFNFINKANKIYAGISLVLSFLDYKEEEKKKQIFELFDKIKKYCTEELEPKVPLVIYRDETIDIYTFKYINLFYN